MKDTTSPEIAPSANPEGTHPATVNESGDLRDLGEVQHSACAIVRAFISIALLVTIYYTFPLNALDDVSMLVRLVLGIVGVFLVMGFQIHAISTSSTPILRAIEAVSIALPLFILFVAAGYLLIAQANGQAFSEDLTRTDALYFSLTVFSTVGFGDITPVSQSARLAVSAQIFMDLLLLGAGLRVVVGAVNVGKKRRTVSE